MRILYTTRLGTVIRGHEWRGSVASQLAEWDLKVTGLLLHPPKSNLHLSMCAYCLLLWSCLA